MNRVCGILVLLFATIGIAAQDNPSNAEFAPLVLVRIIPMPGVEGRFDHMAVDNKTGRVFAANYGINLIQGHPWAGNQDGRRIGEQFSGLPFRIHSTSPQGYESHPAGA